MSAAAALRPIGDVVAAVKTWSPEDEAPDAPFTYIDLSAVDQDLKQIRTVKRIVGSKAPSRARQLVATGDVLVSTVRPNLNGVARIPPAIKSATASTGFCVLRPKPEALDGGYLFHWVRAPRFVREMVRRATGASYPAVSDRIVLESKLPLPPLPEQRRIACILDKADALRGKRRAALAQLDTLARFIFLEMFGEPATNPKKWPMRTIGDLLESASYGTSERAGANGAFPVLRMNNIMSTGEMTLADLKYMDLEERQRERYLVRAGDVLFNRTNSADLVGKSAIYRGAPPMAYAGYLIRLRVNSDNHPEYLAAFLNSAYAKRVLRGMCKSIIGMANINAREVKSIKVAEPDQRVQGQFAALVTVVERLKRTQHEALSTLDALFASLQHRAFRGEL